MVTEVPIVTSLKRWWRQPDSYNWISSYLRNRGMFTISRALIASITAMAAVVGAVLMASPTAVQGTGLRALAWTAIVGLLGCTALWIRGWPTKRQSIAFLLVFNLCIAVLIQAQSDPMVGLVGVVALAIPGGYIACFHSAGFMAYNFAVVVYLCALQVFRHGFGVDAAEVVAALLFVLLMNTGVPFGVQAVVHVLGIDLLQARHDPLTGLLNRRSFFDRIDEMLYGSRVSPRYLVMIMVDLDRFKLLNDTSGHAVGDQALIAVGQALIEIARGRVVTGRVGGEEFMIAELTATEERTPLAQQVCDAVAALPFPITASVGAVVSRVDHLSDRVRKDVVEDLCTKADAAMYIAKRSGGNQVRHV